MYKEIFNKILLTMKENNYELVELETTTAINARNSGKQFSINEHIEALIWSLLSNQRSWKGISDNKEKIRNIFNNFDISYIKKENPDIFINKLLKIKCGNRAIKKQMYSLKYNIELFEKISIEYGSMDTFIMSDIPEKVAEKLSKGKYKLKQIGLPLAMEYLRNVGVDTIKPDVHICRILGADKLHFSTSPEAKEHEAIQIIKNISEETKLSCSEIDYVLWQFCANGYAEICTKNPNCEICQLKDYCKYKK